VFRSTGCSLSRYILADVDRSDPRRDRNACHVAASRARHVLHVFAVDGDWYVEGEG